MINNILMHINVYFLFHYNCFINRKRRFFRKLFYRKRNNSVFDNEPLLILEDGDEDHDRHEGKEGYFV